MYIHKDIQAALSGSTRPYPYDPKREGGKIVPDRAEIPAKYHPLLRSRMLDRGDLFITNDDRLSRKHVPDVKFTTSLERAYL